MKGNFSFDGRVARQYRAQRAHPPEVSEAVGRAMAAQVGDNGRVLEVGVGTGRIAWPVMDAGCRVVGFDLSANMLDEVFAERPRREATHLTLLQADMHQLPFQDDQFDGVMMVHVLHLAKDLRQVLGEIGRVLNRGGVLLQGNDWMDPESVIGRMRDELRRRVMALAPGMKPPSAGEPLEPILESLGGTETETVVAAEWTFEMSPAERLAAIEAKMDAESWFLPDPMFTEMVRQMREWAAETWPDLEQPQPNTRRFYLKSVRGRW